MAAATLFQKLKFGIINKIYLDAKRLVTYSQRFNKASEVLIVCITGVSLSVLLKSISTRPDSSHVFHLGVMLVGSFLTLGSSDMAKSKNVSGKAVSNAVLLKGLAALLYRFHVSKEVIDDFDGLLREIVDYIIGMTAGRDRKFSL